jgi:hypothetical protein
MSVLLVFAEHKGFGSVPRNQDSLACWLATQEMIMSGLDRSNLFAAMNPPNASHH